MLLLAFCGKWDIYVVFSRFLIPCEYCRSSQTVAHRRRAESVYYCQINDRVSPQSFGQAYGYLLAVKLTSHCLSLHVPTEACICTCVSSRPIKECLRREIRHRCRPYRYQAVRLLKKGLPHFSAHHSITIGTLHQGKHSSPGVPSHQHALPLVTMAMSRLLGTPNTNMPCVPAHVHEAYDKRCSRWCFRRA
jgi:hypothetical protein